MAKSTGQSRHMGERRRIKNKEHLLAKKLKKLQKEKSIEHVKRDCRIGRTAEGFQKEAFKCKPPKHPVLELGKK